MTGLVILAAGASTRLGEPKQQLSFHGQTLLQRSVQVALAAGCEPVVVVLGANAGALQSGIQQDQVVVVENEDWQEGMGSSIRCGLSKLLSLKSDISSCIFMVCDQPFVDAALLHSMICVYANTSSGIVACSYSNTLGVPVLFDKAFFPDLFSLKGQEGAKKILFRHKETVMPVSFPRGGVDIDTAADYAALLSNNS